MSFSSAVESEGRLGLRGDSGSGQSHLLVPESPSILSRKVAGQECSFLALSTSLRVQQSLHPLKLKSPLDHLSVHPCQSLVTLPQVAAPTFPLSLVLSPILCSFLRELPFPFLQVVSLAMQFIRVAPHFSLLKAVR